MLDTIKTQIIRNGQSHWEEVTRTSEPVVREMELTWDAALYFDPSHLTNDWKFTMTISPYCDEPDLYPCPPLESVTERIDTRYINDYVLQTLSTADLVMEIFEEGMKIADLPYGVITGQEPGIIIAGYKAFKGDMERVYYESIGKPIWFGPELEGF